MLLEAQYGLEILWRKLFSPLATSRKFRRHITVAQRCMTEMVSQHVPPHSDPSRRDHTSRLKSEMADSALHLDLNSSDDSPEQSADACGRDSESEYEIQDDSDAVSDDVSHGFLPSETNPQHVIRLSSIEHCMPRAYIRICLAYPLGKASDWTNAFEGLDQFVRKVINAKPYLAGYVVPVTGPGKQTGMVEISFTDKDFERYPRVTVRKFTPEEMPYNYDQLHERGMPPSLLRPELVSALPEGTNEERAPVFRVQANLVQGGVIVSIYLHHCISDGTGLGLLASGSVLDDEFAFDAHLDPLNFTTPTLTERLEAFANHQSIMRQDLSWSSSNQINDRHIAYRHNIQTHMLPEPEKPLSRGCIIALSEPKLMALKETLRAITKVPGLTTHDVLQAFLWHHMSAARRPSLQDTVTSSKLLTPVNIRDKLNRRLPEHYFGSAIDFACSEASLDHLSRNDDDALAESAVLIHQGINSVDEKYIRQAIALARSSDPLVDVRDLLASNMNRSTGADMYITSWARLALYKADMGMGLGQPDWVRKPWSKDPGSCIVLPRDERRPVIEVVVQMTQVDLQRLLINENFGRFVDRVID